MNSKTTLHSVNIGKVIRNARLFNVRSTAAMGGNLENFVAEFFDLLESRQVSYLLVGNIALLNYVSGRNTENINLIVSVSTLKQIPELTISHQDQDFAQANFRGLQIDLLLTQNKLFEYVQRNCTASMDFRGRSIPCGNVDGLVLLKLYALPSLYRQGEFDRVALYETDLTMLMQHYQIDVDAVVNILKKHLSTTDVESLGEILDDINTRIQRFKRQNDN